MTADRSAVIPAKAGIHADIPKTPRLANGHRDAPAKQV